MAHDNRYLIRLRQTWFAIVEVPPSLRSKLGRRIKRSLRTHDINIARARRWHAVADIKAQIEGARRTVQAPPLQLEALALREVLASETRRSDLAMVGVDQDDANALSMAYGARTDDIVLGPVLN